MSFAAYFTYGDLSNNGIQIAIINESLENGTVSSNGY